MSARWRKGALAWVVVLGFAAGLGGALAGRALLAPPRPDDTQLHRLLHDQLDLDAGQAAEIARIEQGFATRKAALEGELRADNADLASAVVAEHGYGPKVAAAVDRSHHAMGELQKATLEHVFAMRSVLRPDQAARFDAGIVKALTAPAR